MRGLRHRHAAAAVPPEARELETLKPSETRGADTLVKNSLKDFPSEGLLKHKYKKHAADFGLDPNDLPLANLKAFKDLARNAARDGRKVVYVYHGKFQYVLRCTADGRPYFAAADDLGMFVRVHGLSSEPGKALE